MRCKDCSTRSHTATARPRRTGRVARCVQCGAPMYRTLPEIGADAVEGTLAQLARFGLAITGAPLLEPKPEASERCAES